MPMQKKEVLLTVFTARSAGVASVEYSEKSI